MCTTLKCVVISGLPTLASPSSEFVSDIRRTLDSCEPNLPRERQDRILVALQRLADRLTAAEEARSGALEQLSQMRRSYQVHSYIDTA